MFMHIKFVFASLVIPALIACSVSSPKGTESVFRIAHPELPSVINAGRDSLAVAPLVNPELDLTISEGCDRSDSLHVSVNCVEINESLLSFKVNAQVLNMTDSVFKGWTIQELIPGVDKVPGHDSVLDSLVGALKSTFPVSYYQRLDNGKYIAAESVSSNVRLLVSQIAARYHTRYILIPLHLHVTMHLQNKSNGLIQNDLLISFWDGYQSKLLYLYYNSSTKILKDESVDDWLIPSLASQISQDMLGVDIEDR